VARAARAALPDFAHPLPSRRGGDRIRVGFVGSHVREHVVMRYFADFMVKLDAARFERFVWSASDARDSVTGEIAASVEHFAAGESTFANLATGIRAAGLDVLVFLDAGLDPRMSSLAALRLAPVQAAFYGHPVTTGLDSVDFFLGGELLETERSDAYYREKLVRLPGLGASIRPGPAPGDGTWAGALREGGRPLLMCLQNLAKIPPSFDAMLAQVAARTRARIVFFNRGAALTARFISRLLPALDAQGLSPAAVHVEPLRPHADYLAGIARADLVLDVPGFSGGATSLDALSAGTPIVAYEGEIARARQSSAMLRRIGLDGLIASDDRDYIDKVLKSVASSADRQDAKARAAGLFGDGGCVAGFEDFLQDPGRGG
jgi:predicted O-linked N-acetylglucosamine transferase (SPINDLY family)